MAAETVATVATVATAVVFAGDDLQAARLPSTVPPTTALEAVLRKLRRLRSSGFGLDESFMLFNLF